ncbi:MAG: OsmC family protein [Candidatus Aminicenantales bacterium]|jgi:putative redox protein
MSEPLTASVKWTGRMHFQGRADFAYEVPLDFGPPLGAGEGIKPMELVLMSLAACSGQTVISLLEKMRQDVKLFSVRAEGRRQEEHPRVFTGIRLEFEVVGPALDRALVEKAVRLSEEKYCPVWAMLKKGVAITSSTSIQE